MRGLDDKCVVFEFLPPCAVQNHKKPMAIEHKASRRILFWTRVVRFKKSVKKDLLKLPKSIQKEGVRRYSTKRNERSS